MRMESEPRFGADGTFFDDGERCRQGAGAQQCGENRCFLGGEVTADLALAAGDRFVDARRRVKTLPSSTMAKGRPNIVAGDFSELTRTLAVEGEGNDGLVVLLVETGLGIGETLAGNRHTAFDGIFRAVIGPRQDIDAARRRGGVRIDRCIDHVEAHLRGRTEQLAQACRVLQTGQLDENTVGADALDSTARQRRPGRRGGG